MKSPSRSGAVSDSQVIYASRSGCSRRPESSFRSSAKNEEDRLSSARSFTHNPYAAVTLASQALPRRNPVPVRGRKYKEWHLYQGKENPVNGSYLLISVLLSIQCLR